MSRQRHILLYLILSISILILLSLLLTLWLPIADAFRIIFGSAFLLIIPGLTWTYVFLEKPETLERFLTSIALSIVFVPLAMFAASKFGFAPSTLSIVIEIVIISLLGAAAFYLKVKYKKHV